MPVAELPPLSVDPEYCVVSRRRQSLAARERWAVFAALATVSLTLAAGFAAVGAWLVAPYTALEVAVLAWAFRQLERRAADWERLIVSGDRLIVERCRDGAKSRREWNRYWVQVELAERAGPRQEAGLALRFAGERWEFGAALPASEQRAVARTLRRLLPLRQDPGAACRDG